MNYFMRIIRCGTIALSWTGKIVIFAMMFFITVSVIMRYVIHRPIIGSNDIVMVMMVTIIMVGFSYTQSQKAHVAVRLFVDKLSPRTQSLINFFNNMVMIAVTLLLAWKTLDYAFYSLRIMDSSDTIEIPFYPFKFIMFIGFLFWALESFLSLFESKSKFWERD